MSPCLGCGGHHFVSSAKKIFLKPIKAQMRSLNTLSHLLVIAGKCDFSSGNQNFFLAFYALASLAFRLSVRNWQIVFQIFNIYSQYSQYSQYNQYNQTVNTVKLAHPWVDIQAFFGRRSIHSDFFLGFQLFQSFRVCLTMCIFALCSFPNKSLYFCLSYKKFWKKRSGNRVLRFPRFPTMQC